MKQLTKFSLLLLLTFSLATYGQTKTDNQQDKPFIDVTGTAEKEVIPDEIFINIVIRERYVNREKITVEAQEDKLKSAMK